LQIVFPARCYPPEILFAKTSTTEETLRTTACDLKLIRANVVWESLRLIWFVVNLAGAAVLLFQREKLFAVSFQRSPLPHVTVAFWRHELIK